MLMLIQLFFNNFCHENRFKCKFLLWHLPACALLQCDSKSHGLCSILFMPTCKYAILLTQTLHNKRIQSYRPIAISIQHSDRMQIYSNMRNKHKESSHNHVSTWFLILCNTYRYECFLLYSMLIHFSHWSFSFEISYRYSYNIQTYFQAKTKAIFISIKYWNQSKSKQTTAKQKFRFVQCIE